MFAVVQAGGRQIRVSPSDVVRIDRIQAAAGSEVSLGRVLLLRTAEQTHIGQPTVAGAEVRAEVLGEQKGEKLRVFFYRRRKNSKKLRGHRQRYTAVRVRAILLDGQVVAEMVKEAPAPAAAPEAPAAEVPAPAAAEAPEAPAAEAPAPATAEAPASEPAAPAEGASA
jgi:large subunit ribosomal protein L21